MGDGLQGLVDGFVKDCPEKATATTEANTESVVIAVILVSALKTSNTNSLDQ